MAEKNEHSFLKGLFAGQIIEENVLPFPQLDSEEKELLQLLLENLDRFAQEKVDSEKIEKEAALGAELLREMGELGLFGLIIPESYGGLGLSQRAYGRVFEALGAIDASLAVTIGAHSSIGLKGLLIAGNDAQKQKYLPKLATGEMIAAFALTEPGSGSDAYSIQTRAEKQPDGSYVLSGNKIWITNGAIAQFFTVFAKTKSDAGDKISAFIVSSDMEGFSHGPEEKKMGIKGSSTVALNFDKVVVPAENLLGIEGKGFKLAMEILNSGRLGLATGCVGGAKTMIQFARDHATQRKQFGRPICEFGLIKEKLGNMAIQTYALESAAYLTCSMVDKGVEDYSIESAICKIAGSEILWSVANEAMQIAGGSSYMQEYPYERLLRDSRINMIFEGTNEILRCFIALTGVKGPGEKLKLLRDAMLNSPIKSLGLFYGYFSQRISRNFYGENIQGAHPELKRETSYIEEHVLALSSSVERILQKHGNKIIDMQFAQKRLADVAIDLYLMIAAVSRSTTALNEGEASAQEQLRMTRSFCNQANQRIQNIFSSIDRNYDELIKETADSLCKTGYLGVAK